MKNYITIIALFTILCLCSCSATAPSVKDEAKPVDDEPTAAIVNGKKILKSELDSTVKMYSGKMGGKGGSHLSDEQLKSMRNIMLKQMIDGELLYQAAAGFPVEGLEDKVENELKKIYKQYGTKFRFEDEIKKNNMTMDMVRENLRKNIMTRNYVEKEVVAKIEISEDDTKAFYEKNMKKFTTPEQVKASHILIKVDGGASKEQKDAAMVKIEKVKERLAAGEDFAAVAKELSEGPSAQNGGDLGFFQKNQMVKPFEEAAFVLKVGEVSDVVITQFGYHIIKVFDKKAAEQKKFEEVKDTVKITLQREKLKDYINKLLDDLRKDAKIEVIEGT